MPWVNVRGPLTHLGRLHGSGMLWASGRASGFGMVAYEIDGYQQRDVISANGRLEGDALLLTAAYAGSADRMVLGDGTVLHVTMSDPEGEGEAEIKLRAPWPDFAVRIARRA